jgi:hypothetical protein
MKSDARSVEVQFSAAGDNSPARLAVTVPAGTSRAQLAASLGKLFKRPELEKFRPRGCTTCLSGLDLHIRERFEQVLTFENF